MAVDSINAARIQPTFRVEVPTVVSINGAPVGKIAQINEAQLPYSLDGQSALIVEGTNAGKYLTVSVTGANQLTFEEDVDAGAYQLANDDRVSVNTRGQPPQDVAGGVTDYFGVFRSNGLPVIVKEYYEGRYHGGDLPLPDEYLDIKNSYNTDMSMDIKNAAALALAMGTVEETTADFAAGDPGQALGASDQYPGADRILMVGVPNALYVDGAIVVIQPGVGGLAEVAKIDGAPVGNYLNIVHPLKNFHKAGAIINLIKQTVNGTPDTVITKTLTISPNLPTYTLEAGIRRTKRFSAGNDMVYQFLGLIMSSLELSSSPGSNPLQATYGLQGLGMRDYQSNGTTELTTLSAQTEVGFDKGSYRPVAVTITVDGVIYHEAGDYNVKLARNIETVYSHNDGNRPQAQGGDPWDHYEGNVNMDMSLSIPMKNKNLFIHLKAGSNFSTVFKYVRDSVATDELSIRLYECYIKGPLFEIPEEGVIPQSVEAHATNMDILIKDLVPYYVL